MLFPDPLRPARLLRRYKRFLADVAFEDGGAPETIHVANPGAMLGLAEPGRRIWASPARNPARKLRWSWELAEADPATGCGLVGVNTAWPNLLAAEAIAAGTIPELAGYAGLRREVPYGRASRIDLLLTGPDRPPCYVEVKNVHLKRAGRGRSGAAEFPDCVTARGARHLAELAAMAQAGARAVMLFVVQREDCDRFRPAADLDPAYWQAFAAVRAAGVEALAYACRVAPEELRIERPLPLELAMDAAGCRS